MTVKRNCECPRCEHEFLVVDVDEYTGEEIGYVYCPLCNVEINDNGEVLED